MMSKLIILGILSLIGFIGNKNSPQEYYYEGTVVSVYKKYQCPKYCQVDHFHYVYFDSLMIRDGNMCINKDKLGKKYKDNETDEVADGS